jgi:hypothetical protein
LLIKAELLSRCHEPLPSLYQESASSPAELTQLQFCDIAEEFSRRKYRGSPWNAIAVA